MGELGLFRGASDLCTLIAIVATAVDRTDASQGLKFGPGGIFSTFIDHDPPNQLHANPFAITVGTPIDTPAVLTVGPTSPRCDANLGCGIGIEAFTVDPTTLAITSDGVLQLDLPEGNSAFVADASIAAGRFGTTFYDQVAIASDVEGQTAKVLTVDFDAQGNPVQKAIYEIGTLLPPGRVWIRSGQLDWSNGFDQAVIQLFSEGVGGALRILSFDAQLNVQAGPLVGIPDDRCAGGLTVGNFDRMQSNPTPPPATIRNPNLQLAVPTAQCASTATTTRIFDGDPPTLPGTEFQITQASTFLLQGFPSVINTLALAAVDLQGRSPWERRPRSFSPIAASRRSWSPRPRCTSTM